MNLIKNQLTFAESMQFINSIVDSVFTQDEVGNDIDYSPETLLPLINSTFVEMYTDYEFLDDFDVNFNYYMDIDINENLTDVEGKKINIKQFNGILEAIDEKISYRKQKLLDSQSSQSEMFNSISTLFSTLNSKAEQIDMKKIDKIIKKLNVNEVVKVYKKSGIGDGIRDKSIQEQANEIKDLKNQISAKNVLADGK